MRIKTIDAVVEPVAGKLLVIGGIAGIKREMRDEKETQSKSGEERGQEVFVERFWEHCAVEDESDCTGIVASAGLAARTTLTKA